MNFLLCFARKKTPILLIFVCFAFLSSCVTHLDPLKDTAIPGVIITRADGNKKKLNVYIDGKHAGKIKSQGKIGIKLPNGRHSIKISYKKQDSKIVDFWIQNSRMNFLVYGFENAEPTIAAY